MSNVRYIYEIIINEGSTSSEGKHYSYDYGPTEGIELSIFKASARIEVVMTVKYQANQVIYYNLFKDALLKTLLVHLLINRANLDIEEILVKVYEDRSSNELIDEHLYKCEKQPIVYSMLTDDLEHPIVEDWSKEEEIGNLLDVKKSHGDRRAAALINFLNSKSKVYESERFLYLWMAFNGMYGHLVDKVKKEDTKQRIKEAEGMQLLLRFSGYLPGRLVQKQYDEIMEIIRPILAEEYKGDLSKKELIDENGAYRDLALKIEDCLYKYFMKLKPEFQKNNSEMLLLDGYTYLLTQFTYHFRCNYFHASKPIPLFMYGDDPDLICLMAMNDLLEEFL